MPFLADELWRNIVAGVCENAASSVHLSGWPQVTATNEALVTEISELREVVELGRQARAEAGVKLRQPLRRVKIYGSTAAQAHVDELMDELRVKEVQVLDEPPVSVRYKPNLRVLGPRLGADLPAVRSALEAGEFEDLGEGRLRAAGHELGPDDVLTERAEEHGWAHSDRFSVGFDLELDDELVREGRVYELVHAVNVLRKERGLDVSDRIVLTIPDGDLADYADRIKGETLAVELRTGAELELAKA